MKLLGRILSASVGMEEHRLPIPSLPHGYQNRLHDQIPCELRLHRPPDHLGRKQI